MFLGKKVKINLWNVVATNVSILFRLVRLSVSRVWIIY
jgi:hypothetical protein